MRIAQAQTTPLIRIARRLNALRRKLARNISAARHSWYIYSRNRLAMAGLIGVIIFALMALSHPLLMGNVWPRGIYNPETGYDIEWVTKHPSPPSARHLLGTDSMGRDVLSRLLYATRPTFILAISAALSTAVTSILIGSLAAYFRGWVDTLLSSFSNAMLLLPVPIFMVMVALWTGDRYGPYGFGIGYGLLAGLGSAAVVLRAQALTVMNKPYIEAARVAGGGAAHIILRHIVPNLLPLAAVQMMVSVAGVVIADGFISWFGVGSTWNRLNWGSMVMWAGPNPLLFSNEVVWHALLPPALALSFFSASFYLISRGLQDIANPQNRDR